MWLLFVFFALWCLYEHVYSQLFLIQTKGSTYIQSKYLLTIFMQLRWEGFAGETSRVRVVRCIGLVPFTWRATGETRVRECREKYGSSAITVMFFALSVRTVAVSVPCAKPLATSVSASITILANFQIFLIFDEAIIRINRGQCTKSAVVMETANY